MAVYAYLGLPGSGKYFHVLKDTILPALRDDRRVFHNLPLKRDVIEGLEFHIGYLRRRLISVNQDFLLSLPKWKPVLKKALLVIDEAHETFFSGDKITDADLRNFWTWHRHLGLDIVVLTQDADNLAKIIKGVIALRNEFRNMGFVGFKSVYEIRQYEGIKGKNVVGTTRGRFNKKYFPYYHSVTGGASNLFKMKAPREFSLVSWVILLGCAPLLALYLLSQLSFFNSAIEEVASIDDAEIVQKEGTEMFANTGQGGTNAKTESENHVNTGRDDPLRDPFKENAIEKISFSNLSGGLEARGEIVANPALRVVPALSIAVEDVKAHGVQEGSYSVKGVIGVGDKYIYLGRGSDGKIKRIEGKENLSLNSTVRVY